MLILIAADEESLTSDIVERSLRSRIESLSTDQIRFFVAGDRGLVEYVAESWGVAPESCVYLGPTMPDLKPLWWWPWIWSIGQSADEYRILAFEDGKVSADSSEHRELSMVLSAWSACQRTVSPLLCPDRYEELGSQIRSASMPSALSAVLEDLAGYLQGACALLKRLLTNPNESRWSDGLSPCGELEYGGARLRAEHAALSKRCNSISASHGVSLHPLALKISGRLLSKAVPSAGAARQAWADRLEVWSALLYVRGEQLTARGHHIDGLVASWRSLECYVHRLGLVTNVVRVTAGGLWSWDSNAHSRGDVTTKKLLDDLDSNGTPLQPTRPRGKRLLHELRLVRNRTILAHGHIGVDAAGAWLAASLVREAIEAYEGKPGPWSNAVRGVSDTGIIAGAAAELLVPRI